ncbi:MAG: TetR/AcrR family transcriptional regulator [Gammaproteobacteria bacterium]|nr:TetR/AcrR family transcriptional regulator [Gammaproteobacteria bacterium]MDH5693962.1 TetR/AcrR family transcriptional regulator [Gammaproteobacteria bacterium]
MVNVHTEQETSALRNNIVEAARNRFLIYGVGKTTMNEIAEDVKMTAGNLYRYFENKKDIAAACALACISESCEKLNEIADNGSLSAREQLTQYVLTLLELNIEMSQEQPKLGELIEFVSRERQEMIVFHVESQAHIIGKILTRGNSTQEFEVRDIVQTAKTIYSSLVLFDIPNFLHVYPKDEFRRLARSLVELLINGLAKK